MLRGKLLKWKEFLLTLEVLEAEIIILERIEVLGVEAETSETVQGIIILTRIIIEKDILVVLIIELDILMRVEILEAQKNLMGEVFQQDHLMLSLLIIGIRKVKDLRIVKKNIGNLGVSVETRIETLEEGIEVLEMIIGLQTEILVEIRAEEIIIIFRVIEVEAVILGTEVVLVALEVLEVSVEDKIF
mgnify:CR=1 FL=1